MPVDDKKIRLRSVLAGKSTEELEELLAMPAFPWRTVLRPTRRIS